MHELFILIIELTWTSLGTFPTFTESIEEIVSSQLVAIVWQLKKTQTDQGETIPS